MAKLSGLSPKKFLCRHNELQSALPLIAPILVAKKKDPNADTSALERQIDEMVYELYGLTPVRWKEGQVFNLDIDRMESTRDIPPIFIENNFNRQQVEKGTI